MVERELKPVSKILQASKRTAVLTKFELTNRNLPNTATPIFCLSARRGLRARLAGDPDSLKASGLAQIEAHLAQFLAQEKQATLRTAIARKASALVGDLQMETEIRLKALRLPLADL
jgi:hypothetical protein